MATKAEIAEFLRTVDLPTDDGLHAWCIAAIRAVRAHFVGIDEATAGPALAEHLEAALGKQMVAMFYQDQAMTEQQREEMTAVARSIWSEPIHGTSKLN